MVNIFFRLFNITKHRKALSIFVFIVLLLIIALLALGIKLEEDAARIIPKDKEVEKVNQFLENFKMNERLVVHTYMEDGMHAEPDSLISITHLFVDSLMKNCPNLIKEVKLEYSESNIEVLYDHYYNYLPFYLTQEDYKHFEGKLNPDSIRQAMLKNLKVLMSPMGMVTKKMLVKDPLGWVGYPLKRSQSLQLDDNIALYQNHLLTKDRSHLIFFITLANSPNETSNNGRLIDEIDQLTTDFERSFIGLRVEYFGQAAVAVANANRIKGDIYITVSVALTFLLIFISLFYRNLSTFFLVLLPGLFGALVAVAVLATVRESVSAISLGVGSVLLGITVDFALHFVTHYKHQKNIKTLFEDLSVPILMSSLTTSTAFFCLLFISSDALGDLGLFAGVSVISAALFTLIVLPHFIIKGKPKSTYHEHTPNMIERFVALLAGFKYHRSKLALGAFLIVSAVSLFTWRHFSFESDMMKLNYMPEHLGKYEQNLNDISAYSANNVFLVSTGDGLKEALEENARVHKSLDSLKEVGLILDYLTVNDIVPEPSSQGKRLALWKKFWDGHHKDSLFFEIERSAVELGFQPGAFAGIKQLLHKDYEEMDSTDMLKVIEVIEGNLITMTDEGTSVVSSIKLETKNKPEVLSVLAKLPDAVILDKAYLTSQLVKLLEKDFSKLVNLSLVIVFAIILLSYGRVELALITFAPILLSWLWVLGLMGLLGLKFNIVNIIICTFIFGLGIDYSIFITRGLLQQYALGIDNLDSYKKSILLSVITTLTGIGVLIFAQHPALKSIALLAIIGIISVVLMTFTLQPILFNFLILKRKQKGTIPFTLSTLLVTAFAFLYFLMGCLLLMLFRVVLTIPLAGSKKRKLLFHHVLQLFSKSLIYVMANVEKEVVDIQNADFEKPSIIIANHHSFIDILLMLMFHPKLVMVTNDWVYNSPFFGGSVKYADFIVASEGMEAQLDKVKGLVDEGYSVVVFPEGTRSGNFKVGRFHKGAFYLAHYLKLDIQPVIIHGTSYVMPKGDGFYLKGGKITTKFLPRIKCSDPKYGSGYREGTKAISSYFKDEYALLREEMEYPQYFTEVMVKNYLYKGPVLEWYLKVKYRLEKAYQVFHELVPKQGRVVDLGCGYGFLPYALSLSGEGREVLGIDYDQSKIQIAQNCPFSPKNLSFRHGDITTYPYGPSDTFVISDVLHYLKSEEQHQLLKNVLDNLLPGGSIIIRDGDSSKKDRHKGTQLTEVFSTKSGFNKTRNELNYISKEMIAIFAEKNAMALEVIDNTKLTSNIIFILTCK